MPNIVDIEIRTDDNTGPGLNKAKGDFDKTLGDMKVLAIAHGAAIGAAFAGPIVAGVGAAAAAFASAGAAVGAFALAVKPQMAGITAVMGAYDKANSGAASGAENSSRRIADAQRSLSAAVRDAAQKHEEALDRVEHAEAQLSDAQKAARRAQLDLNDARNEAKRDLEDLASRMKDTQLSVREATFRLTDAQREYNTVLADPTASDEAKARAKLALDEAQFSSDEQQRMLKRVTEEERNATKAGVEGSAIVKNAKAKITDANKNVKDSEESVADARKNVARVDQQASDAIAAARSALAAASQKAGAAEESFQEKLAKLPPASRETALALIALKEETKAWSDSLAPKTMPVMTEGINILRDIIPQLTPLVTAAADSFREFLGELGKDVSGGGLKQFIGDLADSARKTLPDFLNSIKNIAVGIGGIISAFLPFSGTVTGGIEGATAAFAKWGQGLKDSEGFKTFIGYIREIMPVLGQFLERVGSAGIEISKGLGPLAGMGLAVAEALGKMLQAIPPDVLAALAPVIMAVVTAVKAWSIAQAVLNVLLDANPVGLIILAIAGLAAVLFLAWQRSSAFREAVTEAWTSIRDAVAPIIEEIWGKIKNDLIPAFLDLIDALKPVVAWFMEQMVPYVKEAFASLFMIIKGAVDIIIGIVKVFTGILTGDWSKVWEGLQQILGGAMEIIQGIVRQAINTVMTIFRTGFSALNGIMIGLGNLILDAFSGIGNGIVNGLRGAWNGIFNGLVWLKNAFLGFFSNAGDWLMNAGQWMVNGLVRGIYATASWVKDAIKWIIPDFLEHFIPGFASGGIIGAAGGGPRSNLVMVGEQGRELVRLPFGSTVIPNGQTEGMMAGAGTGGGGRATLYIDSAGSRLDDLLVEVMRMAVRDRGGDVQLVLGR